MSLRTKSYRVAIQTKFLYLYFHMVLFVLLFVCNILPLATFGSERNFAGEFHILNGTVVFLLLFLFLTASSGLVHPLVLVEDSIEGINPNSMNSAGASR